jgi:hypothetical protein
MRGKIAFVSVLLFDIVFMRARRAVRDRKTVLL